MAKLSDEDRLVRHITRRFNKGVTSYGLLEDGDKILVGLSGGKDSLVLLEFLARRSRIFKPRFTVEAVHVVMSNIGYRSDINYLRDYCSRLGVVFHLVETSFVMQSASRKPHCFLCAWHRRKAMFALARQLGCNKIALGHHSDDIIETLLLNMTFLGQFSTMRPMLRMSKFDMTIIRPLCLVAESDISQLASMRGFRSQLAKCPYETDTRRSDMKRIFNELQTINPEARYSLWHSIERTFSSPEPDTGSESENTLFI